MPLGLTNDLETLQITMDVILSSVRRQFTLVYLDDTVGLLKPLANYTKQVQCVLRLLYDAVVTLKLKKCKVFANSTNFLHRVI